VPSDGSASPVRLNATLVAGGKVEGVFGVSSVNAGERVVYQADQDVHFVEDLYSVPADGSAGAVKLNAPLANNLYIPEYSSDPFTPRLPFGANHALVVFALDTIDYSTDSSTVDLYSVPIDGSSSAVVLNGPPPAGGRVETFPGWRFAGNRVAYFADQDRVG